MTQQSFRTNVLTQSKPLLAKCLQAALIAAPVLLAAAPSEAYTLKTTVNGFTGEFAPSNWNRTPTSASNGNSSVVTATTNTLVKNSANNAAVSSFVDLTDSLFAALLPYQGAGRLLSWTATGDYTWNIGAGTATNTKFDFNASSNDSFEQLNNSAPDSGSFSLGNDYTITAFDPNNADNITFSLTRLGGNATGAGTGVINNFQFIAEYEVPGPLPVVGAAAAFAWSRKLRNRLKSAKTLA